MDHHSPLALGRRKSKDSRSAASRGKHRADCETVRTPHPRHGCYTMAPKGLGKGSGGGPRDWAELCRQGVTRMVEPKAQTLITQSPQLDRMPGCGGRRCAAGAAGGETTNRGPGVNLLRACLSKAGKGKYNRHQRCNANKAWLTARALVAVTSSRQEGSRRGAIHPLTVSGKVCT